MYISTLETDARGVYGVQVAQRITTDAVCHTKPTPEDMAAESPTASDAEMVDGTACPA